MSAFSEEYATVKAVIVVLIAEDWYLFKEGEVLIGSTTEALSFVGSNDDSKS